MDVKLYGDARGKPLWRPIVKKTFVAGGIDASFPGRTISLTCSRRAFRYSLPD